MSETLRLTLAIVVILGVSALLFLCVAYPTFIIAKKRGTEPAWHAFVPYANLGLIAALASNERRSNGLRGGLLLLGTMVPWANLLVYAIVWANISVNTGRSPFWGYLTIVPGLNLVLYWVIARRALPLDAPGSPPSPPMPLAPPSDQREHSRSETIRTTVVSAVAVLLLLSFTFSHDVRDPSMSLRFNAILLWITLVEFGGLALWGAVLLLQRRGLPRTSRTRSAIFTTLNIVAAGGLAAALTTAFAP